MILADICGYVTTKSNASDIRTPDHYITTECMKPDRGGISQAAAIPQNGKVTRFSKGDILLSNIRPYFKKIWHAEWDGYCSNDVLVIRQNNPNSSNLDYLYALISSDEFFIYDTATSKGTKMPRGDKESIMQYEFTDLSLERQEAIGRIASNLNQKITLNNRINDYLAELRFFWLLRLAVVCFWPRFTRIASAHTSVKGSPIAFL